MRLFYLLFIVLMGCTTTTTQYDVKNNIPFSQIEFAKTKTVGIAIFNNSIDGLKKVIETDCLKFAGKQMEFKDLSGELTLANNNSAISNPGDLSQKHKDIKYIIAVVEQQPKTKKDYFFEEMGGSYASGSQARLTKVNYETTMGIPSEIMLFQMPLGQLIAKAQKEFNETKIKKDGLWLPENLIQINDDNYPQVQNVTANSAVNYFYDFLKDIDSH